MRTSYIINKYSWFILFIDHNICDKIYVEQLFLRNGEKALTDKQLKDNLWHSADVLRAGAHLAANKYGQSILGLIFLRYADILFKQHKDEIEVLAEI